MVSLTETERLRSVKKEKISDGDAARLRTVKRERISKSSGGDRKGGVEERDEERKRARVSKNVGDTADIRRRSEVEVEEEEEEETVEENRGGATARRELRSRYMTVKSVINGNHCISFVSFLFPAYADQLVLFDVLICR